jgi:predicted secreted protein
MTAQKGKDLLVKISDGASYTTIAGLRTRRLAFNAEPLTLRTPRAPTVGASCSMGLA